MFCILTNLYPNITCPSLSCLNTGDFQEELIKKEMMTEKQEGFGPHTLGFYVIEQILKT